MLEARELNLIPYDVILKEKTAGRAWMWSGIVFLLIMFLLGMYGIAQRQISTVEGVISDLSMKKMEIEALIKQVNILQDKRDQLVRKERVINMLLSKRSISFLFAELEKAMNENVWLTSFHFQDNFSVMKNPGNNEDSGEWVETGYFIVKKDRSGTQKNSQNEAPEATTLLRGKAKSNTDLARLLKQLSTSVIFSAVNMRYAREEKSGGTHMVEFEIETHLKSILQI